MSFSTPDPVGFLRATHLVIALLLLASPGAWADTLRAGIAISLKEAVESIAPGFEKKTGHTFELTFGGSGHVAMQIQSGAPIDLYIAAAQSHVDDLVRTGHVDPALTRTICGNTMVLITPANAEHAPTSFESLAQVDGRVAIGEPGSVPAGQYAMQVFTTLKLRESLTGKLVYGASVRQVLAYVERGEVAAGVVYATDAKQAGNAVKVVAQADPSWHKPIVYPGAILKASKQPETAKAFLDYLQTPEAREVLTSHGFTVPSEPATRPTK